ncbi:thermonuclease family protein, partial [Candidatus Margulisiibacteriota bacterium]
MRILWLWLVLLVVLAVCAFILLSGFGGPPPSRPEGSYIVEKAIDGQTVRLMSGEIVRYIGIFTPRYQSPRDADYYGEEAFRGNASLVEGKEVRLEFDVQKRDGQGRLLAYVFLDYPALNEVIFVNGELVKGGFARANSDGQNTKYDARLQELENKARQAVNGFWAGAPKTFDVRLTGVSRTSFNPANAERINYLGYLDISFSASRYVDWVFQVIAANSNTVVKELKLERSKSGQIRWTGDDNNGKALPQGEYLLRIFGLDKDGQQATDSCTIIIDTVAPWFASGPRLS